MTRIELAPEFLDDFERFFDHLSHFGAVDGQERVQQILEGIDVLARSPLIGRPVPDDLRELVIGRGSRGYVALYRYLPDIDTVFVLALRARHEPGFRR